MLYQDFVIQQYLTPPLSFMNRDLLYFSKANPQAAIVKFFQPDKSLCRRNNPNQTRPNQTELEAAQVSYSICTVGIGSFASNLERFS